jgi:hypothetical protein
MMTEGTPPHCDETVQRHLRLGAIQELSRARAAMEGAARGRRSDPELIARLEEIERELTERRPSMSPLARAQRMDAVGELLMRKRLVLDQLGFDSYEEYVGWRDASDRDEDDFAYFEFAQLAFGLAEERLAAIERGELDLDWIQGGRRESEVPAADGPPPVGRLAGGTEPNGEQLDAWRNPFEPVVDLTSTEGPKLRAPRVRATDLAELAAQRDRTPLSPWA